MTRASRNGTSRDCTHPRASHTHGTVLAYSKDLCRCRPCTDANAAYQDWWKRQRAYGRPTNVNRPRVTDATGTRRRIQALATLGYSVPYLARALGVSPGGLMAPTGRIQVSTAEGIARLYDNLWGTPRPTPTLHEMRAAARVASQARLNGFHPPLAWDDDSIDDPDAQPADWQRRPQKTTWDIEDAEWLIAAGATRDELARRFGVDSESVRLRLSHRGRADLIRAAARNETRNVA